METIAAALGAQLHARANRIALVFDDRTISYGELGQRSREVAAWMSALGITRGDRVAFALENRPELVFIHVANLLNGFVSAPLNTRYTSAEISKLLSLADPSLLFCSLDTLDSCREACATLPNPPRLVCIDDDRSSDAPPFFESPTSGSPSSDRHRNAAAEDPALICFTSGTTGASKGVMLRQRHLFAAASTLAEAWKLGGDDHLLLCLPLFHVHGLANGVQAGLAAGMRITLLEKFESETVLRLLGNPTHDFTLFYGVPTFYHRLLRDLPNEAVLPRYACTSPDPHLSRQNSSRSSKPVSVARSWNDTA